MQPLLKSLESISGQLQTLKPLFSVIIPTYHRNNLLAQCLARLAPGVQTLSEEQYEVIVTDDGSETTAEQMICEKYPWARWVPGPHKGPAANRNNGAKYAQGQWLVFTDDDCLPDPQFLGAYSISLQMLPSYLVFEGRTYVDRPKRSLSEKSPGNANGGYLWSCNLAINKQLFTALNGFDERFPYAAMEDVDLRFRLQKQGYQFLFVKDAAVCHPWRDAGGWKQLQEHQESTLIYLSIHPEEIKSINSIYYLKISYRFLKDTFLALLQAEFAGISYALMEQCSFWKMAFILLRYQRSFFNS